MFNLPLLIKEKCEVIIGANILSTSPIGGGDINEARLLNTTAGRFFLKMNTFADALLMFETEAKGLKLLKATNAIRIPQVYGIEKIKETAFLLLEFIETDYRQDTFWETFGEQLAALHRQSSTQFGLDYPNFIGSLSQTNQWTNTWTDFFIQARLLPQLQLAQSLNRLTTSDFHQFNSLFKKLPNLCPEEIPALIHGDLWSGNFLVSAKGEPALIDPSVSYSHREMDLAMSRLFGGFGRPFYTRYHECYPLENGFEQRVEVYQLYYLLVHVNLFGGGYANSIRRILKKFV